MTKEKIIQSAIHETTVTQLSEIGDTIISDKYDEYKESLLDRYDWTFSLKVGRILAETSDGDDLGYKYKYRLLDRHGGIVSPISVLAINVDQLQYPAYGFSSVAQAADYGISIESPEDTIFDPSREGFFFKESVLHSDCPVTSVIFKPSDSEASFPIDFSLALTFKLAAYIARTELSDKLLADDLVREHKSHLSQALINERKNRKSKDTDTKIIINWLKVFNRAGGY